MAEGLALVRGSPADIEDIMVVERGPGFEALVGRWEAAQHESEMEKPGSLYLLLRPAEALAGFAMLQQMDSPYDAAYLKRIAVREPGRGTGGLLLDLLLRWLFTETAINRLSLEVFPENERARRAYEKAGFEIEGLCREAYRRPDGPYRDALLMAVLRRDWHARNSSLEKRGASGA